MCVGRYGNKFSFGHDGFAMLEIQLQRMDLWFDWFFWEEFWSRDSNGSCQCLKLFNTRRSAETTAPSCSIRLFFLEILSLFLLGVTIFISFKKKKKRKERTRKDLALYIKYRTLRIVNISKNNISFPNNIL